MSFSENVRFVGRARRDEEFPHPAGASIARTLAKSLIRDGWNVGEIENWRDVGWSLTCEKNGAELRVALSAIGAEEWLLQVAPNEAPGIIGRLLGRAPSGDRSACLDLAKAVHVALKETGDFAAQMWRWDGLPDPENSTAEPL